ncbi:MAG: hypothetical protein AAGA87_15525 [Pseudomonadota bacterium]
MLSGMERQRKAFVTVAVATLVVVALLAPRMAAAALSFLPGYTTVAICTGAEIVYLTLDSEGNPVNVGDPVEVTPCVLADADTSTAARIPAWHALAADWADPFVAHAHSTASFDVLLTLQPSRAPPAV